MLGFDDYDFQTLVMEQKTSKERPPKPLIMPLQGLLGLGRKIQAEEDEVQVRTCGHMCQERLMVWALMD